MTHDFKNSHEVLLSHQKWRQGCDNTPSTIPKELTKAIDDALYALRLAENHANQLAAYEGRIEGQKAVISYLEKQLAARDAVIEEVVKALKDVLVTCEFHQQDGLSDINYKYAHLRNAERITETLAKIEGLNQPSHLEPKPSE